jgi:4-amino-4-deoxy-L-arabinose transferase-like glycosyltransferase
MGSVIRFCSVPGNQEVRDQGMKNQDSGDRGSRSRHFLIFSFSDALIPSLLILAGVLLLTVWLRWRYVVTVQPYPDEFVTLLAVKMILEKGVPVFPSGLFYEHGLLFSYAGAAASALLDYNREAVRATSLAFSLLTVILTWHMGRRWYSEAAGLLAATLLAVAPAAVLWGGRARMYALLQFLVLLTLYFAYNGALDDRPTWRRLALVCYLGATLTQFVAITLIPPLVLAAVAVGWYGARQRGERSWFQTGRMWLDGVGLALVVLVAFLVKRAGQPKGVAPLEATGAGLVAGIAQVVAIYGDLSTDLAGSWGVLAPFFTSPEAILPAALALLATGWSVTNLIRRRLTVRDLPTFFLALILVVTTLEMVLFVSPERRDEKYLFMLQPALFLLAADGLTRLGDWIIRLGNRGIGESGNQEVREARNLRSSVFGLVVGLALIAYTWPATWSMLGRTGADYDTAFEYVRDHWREGDAILTGTPAAAALYLDRNDYYAVRGTGGYAYRILERDGKKIDRWMGSPWLETDAEIHSVLSVSSPVWLVLERWGLIEEYYSPLTMQRILAMTDFVREDNGIVVLRSQSAPPLIPEDPTIRLAVNFDNQLRLDGYDLAWRTTDKLGEDDRALDLVLYWRALQSLPYDYTVFVHVRDAAGRNVVQGDHQPLAPVYPPTLWPVGQTIRERSVLTVPEDVPVGTYDLWIGLYRLDTLERLPLVNDTSGENAVWLGQVVVR